MLVRNSVHEQKRILEDNLRLIGLFAMKWKNRYHVSKKELINLMSNESKEQKNIAKHSRIAGLQALAIFLKSGVPLYDKDIDVNFFVLCCY
jgi:hypothetical protein